jgi:hypothetical protein
MIQRIQSIWLLLAAIFAFAGIRLPFYSGTSASTAQYQELNAVTGGVLILILTIAVGITASVAIFLYKNRTVQIRLCFTAILLEALLIFLYYRATASFSAGTYALTAIIQSAIILLLALAARSINNDEKLIQESDRLR